MEEIIPEIKSQKSDFLQVEFGQILEIRDVIGERGDFSRVGLNKIVFVNLCQTIWNLIAPHVAENLEKKEIIFLIFVKLNWEKFAFAFQKSFHLLDEEFEAFDSLKIHVEFLEEIDLSCENILQKCEFTYLVVIYEHSVG